MPSEDQMAEVLGEEKPKVSEEVKPPMKEDSLTKEDIEWIKKQRSQPAAITSESNPPTIQKVEVMTVSDETIEAPLTETETKKVETSGSAKPKAKTKRQAKRLW